MIEKAKVKDGLEIQKLINIYAKEGKMLERAILEIYESIRDFFVYKKSGKIIGVAALTICWSDLAEIRSLAVVKSESNKGLGEKLVKECLNEAKKLGIKKVFVLTYIPEYFYEFGFKKVDRNDLPHKIWKDCVKCSKFPDCGEVPMVKEIR
ncbi:MAG: N-acetyltransferase [Candidatus Firestonebacteria bacterium]